MALTREEQTTHTLTIRDFTFTTAINFSSCEKVNTTSRSSNNKSIQTLTINCALSQPKKSVNPELSLELKLLVLFVVFMLIVIES